MYFQIKQLILWPRRDGFEPRKLDFAIGKLNIITGASRTGKSAIIPIIDYCFGSKSCSIPILTIREECSWFGVLVQTEQGEKLFARREPGNQRETGDMYVLEAHKIKIPEKIYEPNDRAERVRRLLDELAGLTNLDFVVGDYGANMGRPSFRDLSAFMFQPQNIIANPDVLFYKADTHEHREKLRTLFPYILNAITPDLLAKQHEIDRLEKEYRRKDREFRAAQVVSVNWVGKIRSKLVEARELGLVKERVLQDLPFYLMLNMLRDIVRSTDLEIRISEETISDSVREAQDLEKNEADLSQVITTLRKRLQEMQLVRDSAASYRDALVVQRDRLRISDWLIELEGNTDCPVCGSDMSGSESNEILKNIHNSLSALERSTASGEIIPAVFDREYQQIQGELQVQTDKLKSVQDRQRALEARSKAAAGRQFQAKKVERFIGGLEEAIRILSKLV